MKIHDSTEHLKFAMKHGLFFKKPRRLIPQRFILQQQLIQPSNLRASSLAQRSSTKQQA
jgi:hypothetical protein